MNSVFRGDRDCICGGEIKWLTPALATLKIRYFLRYFIEKPICQSKNRLRGQKHVLQHVMKFRCFHIEKWILDA